MVNDKSSKASSQVYRDDDPVGLDGIIDHPKRQPEVGAISVRKERSSVGWQARTFFTWEMYNGEVSMAATTPMTVSRNCISSVVP
jgi:hypothetical protein